MIKHISLDYWNTIAHPNNSYSLLRTDFISNLFQCSVSKAQFGYTAVKSHFDKMAEEHGLSFHRNECISSLFSQFGHNDKKRLNNWFGSQLDKLFEEYPPIISEELISALIRAAMSGFTISVGSNTNFILGSLLRKTIHKIPFTYFVFSDEIGVSKPHAMFFEKIFENANDLTLVESPNEIIHIGDNLICDGYAVHHGMHFAKVERARDTAAVVNRIVEENT